MPRRRTTTKPKRKTKQKRMGGVGWSASRAKYRTRYIGSELQLTNRRPQQMTTKLSVMRTYFLRPQQGVNNWSFLRIRCGSPFEPWATGSGGQLQPARWNLQSFVDSTIFDQFGALYEEAFVVGAKCTAHVKFIGERNILSLEQAPNALQQVVVLGITANDDPLNGAPTPGDTCSTVVKKQNFRSSRVLCGGQSNKGSPNTNIITQTMFKQVSQKAFYSPKKLLGIKDVSDYEEARFKMIADNLTDDARIPPMYGGGGALYDKGPYFSLGISHESDSLGGEFNRLNHNDAYVTVKVDYIIKMVKPTPDRGFNYRMVPA